jgi:hypothetical protein
MCHPNDERGIRSRIATQVDPGIKQDPISKLTNMKRAGA